MITKTNAAKALVLSGDGINCQSDLAFAFSDAGAEVDIVHVNELLKDPKHLLDYDLFGIPGGFSFGDELRSGKILAEKMRSALLPTLHQFIASKKLAIGICNGFQVLMQLGIFEEKRSALEKRTMTLITNDHGRFQDFWTQVTVQNNPCTSISPWFQNLTSKTIAMPVRHKEGRILIKSNLPDNENALAPMIALKYQSNINGSYEQAAGLLDSTGQILGMMPHPEAATYAFLNPLLQFHDGNYELNADLNRALFLNAVNYSTTIKNKRRTPNT